MPNPGSRDAAVMAAVSRELRVDAAENRARREAGAAATAAASCSVCPEDRADAARSDLRQRISRSTTLLWTIA
jgi:hypothetical protein